MQKFYRLRNSIETLGGPFYPSGVPIQRTKNLFAPFGIESTPNDNQFRHAPRSIWVDRLMAGATFPGVFRCERPARGALDCPAPAGITNHSTLTLNDGSGSSGDLVLEFVKSGSASPGNQEVDISAVSTGAEVADVVAASIAAWTLSLGLSAFGGGPGFIAETDGSTCRIVQAGIRKHEPGAHTQIARGTWFVKTTGVLGNVPIVASVPGEWAGRLSGMSGGKARRAGVYARLAQGRAQCLAGLIPEIIPTPPDLG